MVHTISGNPKAPSLMACDNREDYLSDSDDIWKKKGVTIHQADDALVYIVPVICCNLPIDMQIILTFFIFNFFYLFALSRC
jgi:hypothetical protein